MPPWQAPIAALAGPHCRLGRPLVRPERDGHGRFEKSGGTAGPHPRKIATPRRGGTSVNCASRSPRGGAVKLRYQVVGRGNSYKPPRGTYTAHRRPEAVGGVEK